jgi:hypothetical protein
VFLGFGKTLPSALTRFFYAKALGLTPSITKAPFGAFVVSSMERSF